MVVQHPLGALNPKKQSKLAKLTQAICEQYWHYGHPGTPILQLQTCFAAVEEDVPGLDAVSLLQLRHCLAPAAASGMLTNYTACIEVCLCR